MTAAVQNLPLDPPALPIRAEADGSYRVGQTRVVLELVLEAFRSGGTPEEIVQAYGTLSLADVYAIAGWYLKHRTVLDAWLEVCEREAEELRQQTEPRRGMSREIRERLLARSRAGSSPC